MPTPSQSEGDTLVDDLVKRFADLKRQSRELQGMRLDMECDKHARRVGARARKRLARALAKLMRAR